MLGHSVARLHLDHNKAEEIYEIIQSQGEIEECVVDLVHKNGQVIPAKLSAKLIKDDQGKPIGQAGFMKDLRSVRVQQDRLEALLEASKIITGTQDIKVVLEQVVKSTLSAFPNADGASIHLHDEEAGNLRLMISSQNYSTKAWDTLGFEIGEGIASWVFEHDKPAIVEDASKDSRYKRSGTPGTPIHKSLICMPLRVRDHSIGVLTLSSFSNTNAFDSSDYRLLAGFAEQSSIAIDNARHFEIVNRESEDRLLLYDISTRISKYRDIIQILSDIVEGATKLLRVEMAVVHLRDESSGGYRTIVAPKELRHLATAPRMSEGLTDLILQGNDVIVIHDTKVDPRINPEVVEAGIKSLVGYPLVVRGKVIGALFLNSTTPRCFGERETRLVSLLVAQAAFAIENAQAFDAINRHRNLLDAVVGASRRLTSTQDLTKQLEAIRRFVIKELSAPMFYVASYDNNKDELCFLEHYEMGEFKETDVVSLASRENWGLSGYVVKTLETLKWFSAEQKKKECGRLNIKPVQVGIPCQSCVVLPLEFEGQVLGVASIQSDLPYAWDEVEVGAFRTIASLLAIAIKNNELFNEIKCGRNRLKAVNDASTEIIKTTNSFDALNAIVKKVCGIVDVCRACAVLIGEGGHPRHIASVGFDPVLELATSIRPEGISMEVVRYKKPQFFPEASISNKLHPKMIQQGIKAAACLPLIHQEKCIGVLWVHYYQNHFFTESETESLLLFANQAAIAYLNARQMEVFGQLQSAIETMSEAEGLPAVLDKTVEAACKVMEADSAILWSFNQSKDQFAPEWSVSSGVPDDIWEECREDAPTRDVTAFHIMRQGWVGVENCEDIEQNPFVEMPTRSLLSRLLTKSFQGIPLIVGGENLGVLYVNFKEPHSFGEDEQKIARTFALHAALALKNARLVEQLNKAHDTARLVAEVTVLEDLQRTLKLVVDGTRETVGCDLVTLYVYDEQRDEFGFPPAKSGEFRFP